jgi:hypothetical protein
MKIDDLIPGNGADYEVRSNDMLYYRYNGIWLPIAYFNLDDQAYIFLDLKITRQVLKVIKVAQKKDVKFFMAYPDDADPSGVSSWKERTIKHYLNTYINANWRKSSVKVDFDLVKNLCEWISENECMEIAKEVYDGMTKSVNYYYTDYYNGGNEVWTYPEDVRAEWPTLWREIQINSIL